MADKKQKIAIEKQKIAELKIKKIELADFCSRADQNKTMQPKIKQSETRQTRTT